MNAEQIKLRALEVEKHELQVQLNHAWRRVEEEAKTKRRLEHLRRFPDSGREKERLLEISCDTWLPALTGVEMPNSRRINCPLPDHGDTSSDCRFYTTSFHCWGCGTGGNVFVFAEHLWGIPRRGSRFPELIQKLVDLLL